MQNFSVYTEYRQLKKVLVCRPEFYRQTEPINHTQRHYFKTNPPFIEALLEEHDRWTQTLTKLGVELVYLPAKPGLPYQMFTRDPGFAVGDHFFLSNMREPVRQGESAVFLQWLEEQKIPFHTIPEGFIEGGDILVHAPYLFVGQGRRTNAKGLAGLKQHLGKEWKVVPITTAPTVLHLDCVLSILDEQTILWSPDLLQGGHEILEKIFPRQIVISKTEAFHLASNLLIVNPPHLIVSERQKRVAKELKALGFKPHPVPWPETKKLGGLFRCASCPLA